MGLIAYHTLAIPCQKFVCLSGYYKLGVQDMLKKENKQLYEYKRIYIQYKKGIIRTAYPYTLNPVYNIDMNNTVEFILFMVCFVGMAIALAVFFEWDDE